MTNARKTVTWLVGAVVLGIAIAGCLASEQDVLEESQAGQLAAPEECVPGDVDADGDVCMPGSNRCCMNDSAGGRYCKGGSAHDTEAECLADGGVKFYTSGGECERLCKNAAVAVEPME